MGLSKHAAMMHYRQIHPSTIILPDSCHGSSIFHPSISSITRDTTDHRAFHTSSPFMYAEVHNQPKLNGRNTKVLQLSHPTNTAEGITIYIVSGHTESSGSAKNLGITLQSVTSMTPSLISSLSAQQLTHLFNLHFPS